MTLTREDLRAAIAAGILTEAQAARLSALGHEREGKRADLPQEDEPFEFFRGFLEICISIGLFILLSGVGTMLAFFGGLTLLTAVPLICAAIAWWWAGYFSIRRRMTLPSMVLATAFGIGIAIFVPFGIAAGSDDWAAILGAAPALAAKLAIGGFVLALIETLSAKMRIFRAPEFLGTAFLLAVLALSLIHISEPTRPY